MTGRYRYPIQAASYMLPGFDESPRLGFQALCAIARWLGSRHEQTSVASVWETLSPQRRRGVVLLLAQLARRRIQSPSSVEETVDHGRESRAAAGRLHAREDYATASRAPGDHLHSPVDASAG